MTITSEDVTNYLAFTRPGLMACPKEMLDDCQKFLQAEADAGRLTFENLKFYKEWVNTHSNLD